MKNYWVKSGILSLMEKLSVQIFAFGSVFILFRGLTKEAFGTWAIFLTLASVIEVARVGLLQNAMVKFLSTADPETYKKISTASLFINMLISAVTVSSLWIFSDFLAEFFELVQLGGLLKIYAFTNLVLIPFFQLNYIQQANLDFKGIFWSNFTRQGLFFGFVLWLFLNRDSLSLTTLAYFQILAALGGSVVALAYCRKYLSFSTAIDFGWVRKLFRFGIYVFGTNAATQLYKSTDKFLLSKIPVAGAVGVALYEAAIKVTNLADVPTNSMASILFPQSAKRAMGDHAGVKELYEKAVGAILSVMIPAILLVIIFAKWVVLIIAGKAYMDAVPILRITMLYGLFIPYAVQFGTVLDSIGMPRINFLFTLGGLVLLSFIDYFLIWGYGTIGAAYGTLLTYGLMFCMMQIFLHRRLGIHPFNPIRYIPSFYAYGIKLLWKRDTSIKVEKPSFLVNKTGNHD